MILIFGDDGVTRIDVAIPTKQEALDNGIPVWFAELESWPSWDWGKESWPGTPHSPRD